MNSFLKSTFPEIIISPNQVPYREAEELMKDLVKQIQNGKGQETLWFLEHPHVFTMGRSASIEEILDHDIDLYQTDRGGKVTYHGPGQRVVYLMLSLKKLYNTDKPDLRQFVSDLENWVISSLREVGVEAFLIKDHIGVWTSHKSLHKKIASIGIRVSKWVSYHGIAINIMPDLNQFKKIIPCGITNFGMTSLKELEVEISIEEFDNILMKQFTKVFL